MADVTFIYHCESCGQQDEVSAAEQSMLVGAAAFYHYQLVAGEMVQCGQMVRDD